MTAIAAVASYDHMRELALDDGQPPLLAALLPLSVDGMILVATLALGDGRRSRWSAWLAFLVGVAASLAANVIVARPDAVARVVSAWPAIALLLTVEVLARSGRAISAIPVEVPAVVVDSAPESIIETVTEARAETPAPQPAESTPAPKPKQRRTSADTLRDVLALISPGMTREAAAAQLGISPGYVRSLLAKANA